MKQYWFWGIFALALLPRVFTLGRGLTTDEAYHWVAYRSSDFLAAVAAGRFADTLITGHPGVTTMWLGSVGLLLERLLLALHLVEQPVPFELHLMLLRLPIAFITALAVALGCWLLQRVLDTPLALLAASLWATDPFLVAHSRLLHLDALLTMLMLLALLALLAACFPNGQAVSPPDWRLLLAAGIATGLAGVTKAPSALLLPGGTLILFVWCWQAPNDQRLRSFLQAGASWLGSGLLTTFVLWPALWVAPVAAVGSVVREVLDNGGAPHPGTFLLGTNYLTNEPGALFYPVTLLARMTPWVVVGLVALPIVALRRWDWLRGRTTVLLLLLASALLLPLALTLLPKKFDRYALPSVPFVHILAACGLYYIGTRLPQHFQRVAAGTVAVLALLLLLFYHPYYLSYYNPLLGGSTQAPALVPVGWGEGLDLTADWLNQQPEPHEQLVATWSPPTLGAYLTGETTWQGAIQDGEVSHLVIYVNQSQTRKESQYFGAIEATCTPLHTITLHGIDYAQIYRVPTYTPELSAPARFANILTVGEGVLVPPAACTCAPYTLTLVFEPVAPPDAPLFLFLHIVGSDGAKALQVDLPLESLIPAEQWQSGEPIPYTLQLELPEGTPAGTYQIQVGLYNPTTGDRVPIQPTTTDTPPPPDPTTLQIGNFEYLPALTGGCNE